jgi:hypothetical protein
MPGMNGKIIVAGAGISGLTLALALLRRGVTIFEQAEELGELGAGVQISPNGTHVLAELGILEELARVSCEPDAKKIRLWNTGQTAGELLGAGLQSANWLYIVWHVGFPIFGIAFALLKDAGPLERVWEGFTSAAILWSVVLTAALVRAATFGVTAGNSLLPSTMLDPVHFSTLRLYVAGFQILLSLVALIVLWNRRRSVLDLWLMVVTCAYTIEIALIVFPIPVRFQCWLVCRPHVRTPVRQSCPVRDAPHL